MQKTTMQQYHHHDNNNNSLHHHHQIHDTREMQIRIISTSTRADGCKTWFEFPSKRVCANNSNNNGGQTDQRCEHDAS